MFSDGCVQKTAEVGAQAGVDMQVSMSLACGGAAGLISSTATFPLDLIRRRMQLEGQGGLRRYRGYFDVARAVFRSGGLKGFYAGIIPEYYKVSHIAAHMCNWIFRRGRSCAPALHGPQELLRKTRH